jgi:hypothetical protein
MFFHSFPLNGSEHESEIYGERLLRVTANEHPFSWNRDERLKHWLSSKETEFKMLGDKASKLDRLFVEDIRSLFSQSYKRLVVQKSAKQQIDELEEVVMFKNKEIQRLHKKIRMSENKSKRIQEYLDSFTFEHLVELRNKNG